MKKIVLIALTVLFSVKLFALDFSIKLLPGYEFATEKLFNDAGGFSVGLGVDVAPITLRERDKLYITGQFASTNFPTKDFGNVSSEAIDFIIRYIMLRPSADKRSPSKFERSVS